MSTLWKKYQEEIIVFIILPVFSFLLYLTAFLNDQEDKDHVVDINARRLTNEQIVEKYKFCAENGTQAKTIYEYSHIVGNVPVGVECGNFDAQKYGDIKKSNITEITIEK